MWFLGVLGGFCWLIELCLHCTTPLWHLPRLPAEAKVPCQKPLSVVACLSNEGIKGTLRIFKVGTLLRCMQSFSSCKSTHGSHGLAMLGPGLWPLPDPFAIRARFVWRRIQAGTGHRGPIPGPFGAHALHGILDEPTWNAARMTLGILHWGWGSFSNSIKLLANLEAELATDIGQVGLGGNPVACWPKD